MSFEARWHDTGLAASPLLPRVNEESADLILSFGMRHAIGVARSRATYNRSPDARAFYRLVASTLEGMNNAG